MKEEKNYLILAVFVQIGEGTSHSLSLSLSGRHEATRGLGNFFAFPTSFVNHESNQKLTLFRIYCMSKFMGEEKTIIEELTMS